LRLPCLLPQVASKNMRRRNRKRKNGLI
jgi:hypothetical protein